MAWVAASTPPSCPTESCRGPTDFIVSSLVNEDTALPIILRNNYPMPIGRIPGFLSRGIKRQFTIGSMHFGSTCSDAKRLMMLAMESQSASLVLPPDLEHRSLFIFSLNEGPALPFMDLAAFSMVLPSMLL